MDATTGAMGSLLPKLATLLMDEYALPKGLRGEVRFLMAELESMYAALRNVAEVPRDEIDPHARIWAAEVREMSYDMEDVVDNFMASNEFSGTSFGKITNSLRKAKTRHQIAAAIYDMKTHIFEISERRDRYRIDGLVSNPAGRFRVGGGVTNQTPTVTVGPPPLPLHNSERAADLIGIEGPRDVLIEMLIEGGDISKKMKILSIVGSGGLGKTALAGTVCQELEPLFDCMAFVSVGLKPDMKIFFKEMARLLCVESYADALEEETLIINKIRECLHNKRFLIVIDDLWNERDWYKVLHSLPDNDCGSRVITTTRVNSMAKVCCSGNDKLIYEIRHLGYVNAKRLFLKRCFDSDEFSYYTDALTEAVDEILKICGGMPLAILSIALLFASKITSEEPWQGMYSSWKEMLGSLQSPRKGIPGLEDLRRILSKSCIDLPGNLKTCLLYLATFSKGQRIERDSLVSKWIAEGFIPEDEGRHEEVAARYFDVLIDRNVIHPVEYGNCLGKGIYEVNYMMLYVLRLISHNEQFVTFLSDFGSSGPAVMPVRLSIHFSSSEHSVSTENMDLSHVRSITMHGPAKSVSFKHSQYLQVLDIEGCKDFDNTDVDLICQMNLLKYLGLKQTQVTVIPSQIGNLQYLETLDVTRTQITDLPPQIGKLQNLVTLDVRQTQVKELPKEIIHLSKLAHLFFGQSTFHGGAKLPVGSNQLKSVKMLGIVDSRECSEDVLDEISELSEVRELEVVLYDGPSDKEQNDRLLFSIGKCSNLQSLTIYGDSSPSDELPTAPIFLQLEKLKVSGRFAKVPKWIETLQVLNIAHIRICKLYPNDLMILGKLPCLSSLALALISLPREKVIVTKSAGFTGLEVFTFDCRVPWVTFEQEAMPSLKHIRFKVYACKPGKTPLGIIHLQSLNKVTLQYSSQYACSDGVTETVDVMKKSAAAHANLIVLYINDNYKIFRPNTWASQDVSASSTHIDRNIVGSEIKEDLASMY